MLFVTSMAVALFFINQHFTSKKQHEYATYQKNQVGLSLENSPIEKERLLHNPLRLANQTLEQKKSPSPHDQDYYVLENEWMQVVFSTTGGSIVEINLPFQTENHPQSAVLPIDFDRIIQKNYSENGHFPNHPYYTADAQGIRAKKETMIGGYYPLLRREIQGNTGTPSYTLRTDHYAFNILSEDPETSNGSYVVTQFDDKMIQFQGKFSNRKITKTYHFPKEGLKAPYCLNISIKVEGDARGLWITSGVPEVELISGNQAPAIKYSAFQNNKWTVQKLSLPKTYTRLSTLQPGWVSNSNGYFALILDPIKKIEMGFAVNHVPGTTDPSRITLIDSSYDLYPPSKYPGYDVHIPLLSTVEPLTFRLYAGPIDKKILAAVDATYTDPLTGSSPNYAQTQSFHGWFAFISEPFAKFLYFIMNGFHSLTQSWGISIILLTLVLRLLMYPLNAWSIQSTLKLQALGPKLQKLQEKHKKDPKKGQMETIALYKAHKVNPFGGCLPLIIQMPFLVGMFDLLKSAFPLRGASFIPGWIDNLTAPDIVFSWNAPLPFIGTSLHLLPILLGCVMFVQQKIASIQSQKNGPLTEQQQQQQKMGMIMTIVFTFVFYKFPSGLNIYWLSSMGLQILQQWYMSKKQGIYKKNGSEIVINSNQKK